MDFRGKIFGDRGGIGWILYTNTILTQFLKSSEIVVVMTTRKGIQGTSKTKLTGSIDLIL